MDVLICVMLIVAHAVLSKCSFSHYLTLLILPYSFSFPILPECEDDKMNQIYWHPHQQLTKMELHLQSHAKKGKKKAL